MRPIKFRGKGRIAGNWFYGNLFIDMYGYTHIFSLEVGGLEVEPETVGQFTGIKDKNGNEIYEGDIIGCDNPKIKHLIIYNEKQGRYMAALNGDIENDFGVCGLDDSRWIGSKEVIGNIYDNPELLKGGEG